MRCESCPVESGSPCIGEHARRICDLCNPAHAAYRPAYRESIAGMSYPSLATMAGNALQAAGRAISAAARGEPVKVDEVERERRLSICRGCDFFDAKQVRCRHGQCGCWLEQKTSLATEHCPIGKW